MHVTVSGIAIVIGIANVSVIVLVSAIASVLVRNCIL